MGLRDQILLQALYTAGLRVSEACGLRWRNLSAKGNAGQVTVFGKGGRTRAIGLPPELWNALNKLQKSAEIGTFVFASRTGQPLDRGRVSRDFSVRPNGADHQWGKDPPKEVVG